MIKGRISKHTLTWTHPITGKPHKVELVHTRDYLQPGHDHLEIHSAKSSIAPHPLSPTGYFSHFIDRNELKAAGGAVRFVTEWLAREAKSDAFTASEHKRLQGNLFNWADQYPSRPTAVPSRRLRARREPR